MSSSAIEYANSILVYFGVLRVYLSGCSAAHSDEHTWCTYRSRSSKCVIYIRRRTSDNLKDPTPSHIWYMTLFASCDLKDVTVSR